jgi:hypothetical protein
VRAHAPTALSRCYTLQKKFSQTAFLLLKTKREFFQRANLEIIRKLPTFQNIQPEFSRLRRFLFRRVDSQTRNKKNSVCKQTFLRRFLFREKNEGRGTEKTRGT